MRSTKTIKDGAILFTLCCSFRLHSAFLGFLLLLATVKLKRGLSQEHFKVWVFLSKVKVTKLFGKKIAVGLNEGVNLYGAVSSQVTATILSSLVFNMDFNSLSLLW